MHYQATIQILVAAYSIIVKAENTVHKFHRNNPIAIPNQVWSWTQYIPVNSYIPTGNEGNPIKIPTEILAQYCISTEITIPPQNLPQLADDIHTIMKNHYQFVTHAMVEKKLHDICNEYRTLENVILFDPHKYADPPKSSIWIAMLAIHQHKYLPGITAHWEGIEEDYEVWKDGRIPAYIRTFRVFAQAFEAAKNIEILMLEDFVASGQQIEVGIEQTFTLPEEWPTNLNPEVIRDFKALHKRTLDKINLHIGALFITEAGELRIQTLCDALGIKVFFARSSETVSTLDDSVVKRTNLGNTDSLQAIRNDDLTKLVGSEYDMALEMSRPFMTFAHKFPDFASVALRWLVKVSYPYIWKHTLVAPYKSVIGVISSHYTRQEEITEDNVDELVGGQERNFSQEELWVDYVIEHAGGQI